jgi:uncharacterized protein RhaS with RHS repeats
VVAGGLVFYLRARYYDPTTGQFVSRDPAVALTRQPYGNVSDNPLNRTDPTGLYDCGWQVWKCIRTDTIGWNQFAANATNPQTLAIAGGSGLAAGSAAAACMFGGCEAVAAGAVGAAEGMGSRYIIRRDGGYRLHHRKAESDCLFSRQRRTLVRASRSWDAE